MSDSIVQILTLKFLFCFLISELNPNLAAKALAMTTTCAGLSQGFELLQAAL